MIQEEKRVERGELKKKGKGGRWGSEEDVTAWMEREGEGHCERAITREGQEAIKGDVERRN